MRECAATVNGERCTETRVFYVRRPGCELCAAKDGECSHTDILCIGEQSAHPHYKVYECQECGYQFTNGTMANWSWNYYSTSSTHTSGLGHAITQKCSKCSATQIGGYDTDYPGCCQCGNHTFISGYTQYLYSSVHPHAEYYRCEVCDANVYTGGYYSGEYPGCSACHVHNYSYSSYYQTAHPHYKVNVCSCGAEQVTSVTSTNTSCCDCGYHSYSSYSYYQTAHPHYKVNVCSCGAEQVTSITSTNTSCCDCGYHSYSSYSYYQTAHPHYKVNVCSCGAQQVTSITSSNTCCCECGYHTYMASSYHQTAHPHYRVNVCTCGAERLVSFTLINGNCCQCNTSNPHSYISDECKYCGYVRLLSFELSTYSKVWLNFGDTYQLTCMFNPVNATDTATSWLSSNTSVVTVNNTGLVTVVGYGTATITATNALHPNLSAQIQIISETYSGEYMIKSVSSRKYATVNNSSLVDGEVIIQCDDSNSDAQKWILTHSNNGYYYVKSKNSNLYLAVEYGSSSNNARIIQTATQGNASLWKILTTPKGNLKLTAYCSFVTDASMYVSSGTDGAQIVQYEYANDTDFRDEWILEQKVDVAMISIPESHNRISFWSDAASNFSDIGYTDIIAKQVPLNANGIVNVFANSKITILRTHGSKNSLTSSYTSLLKSDLDGYPSNTFDYSQIIILGACLTAEGGEFADNIAQKLVDKGARTVIGFENRVEAGACNEWCKQFAYYLNLYYNQTDKNLMDVCNSTDIALQPFFGYEWYKDGILQYTLRNYVLFNSDSFPD